MARRRSGGYPKKDRVRIQNGLVVVDGDHFMILYEIITSDARGNIQPHCSFTVQDETLNVIYQGITDAQGIAKFPRELPFQKYGDNIVTRVRISDTPIEAINMIKLRLEKPLLVAGPQPEIRAGQGPVQLNILSLDDPEGHRNYTCKIISHPQLGNVKYGGLYCPPKRIYKDEEVVIIEACLNIDRSQKIKILLKILKGA